MNAPGIVNDRGVQLPWAGFVSTLPGIVCFTGTDGQMLFINDAWTTVSGLSIDDVLGWGYLKHVHPADRDTFIAAGSQCISVGTPMEATFRLVTATGDERWMSLRAHPVEDDGDIVGFSAVLIDQTALIEAQSYATELAAVINDSADFVVIYSPDGGVRYASDAARVVLGFHDQLEAWGRDMLTAESQETLDHEAIPVALSSGVWRGELSFKFPDYELPVSAIINARVDERGQLRQVSLVARDISEFVHLQDQLTRQATHDTLTGLSNRRALMSRLNRSEVIGGEAIMFMDLDGFKEVNDQFGHEAGDAVLIEVGERLTHVLRGGDTVARLGGDEFVVVIPSCSLELAEQVAQRIIRVVQEPIVLDEGDAIVGISIGIHIRRPDENGSHALAAADMAMYEAKVAGKGTYRIAADSGPSPQ